jgi:hypothetical protein
VWYVWRGTQRRRVYVKPADPQTQKQRRWRARFAAASRKYSRVLTDKQQDACIAAGAKQPCRPRLGPSGSLTGQQFLVRKEYARKAKVRCRKAMLTAQLAQMQALTEKLKSQPTQFQRLTVTISGPHRLHTGSTPDPHRPHALPPRKRGGVVRSKS